MSKNVSDSLKEKTKKIKQQKLKLGINNGELTVGEINFMTVETFNAIPLYKLLEKEQVIAKQVIYGFEGQLFKTIMKQIEITVKNAKQIKDKSINFQYGIYVNNNFEFIDLGDYYIKDAEDDKGKTEIVVTGYDKMINFMKTFKQSELQLTYPCTMLELIQKMCEVCGVELYSTDFFNADLEVSEDYFTAQELTYRDVLEKVAQSTLTTIFIKDNKLYLHKLANNPVEKLDISYLTGLIVKEKFGPVNALVLGRGDVEDNVEAKDEDSISQNGRCEIRFDENEFVEYQREQVIDAMFEQVKGLEYYSFEGSDVGIMWLDPCDLIELEDREKNTYKSIYLKANITINTGISSDTGADIIDETNTEYKVTTKEEKKTLKVERMAKKNEGLIQDLIEEQTETTNKISQVEQTIDGITQTVSSVETKIETVEGKADTAQSTANTANQNAQNAQTAADNAQDTADSAVNQITTTTEKVSQIEQTVDGITQNVTNLQTTLSEDYSTTTEMNTAIEQSANSITSEVTEKIDSIQVGGTNLVPNSAPYSLDDYVIADNTAIELTLQDQETAPFGKCIRLKALKDLTASSNGIFIYLTQDTLEVGKQYSFSLWMKATANTNMIVGYGAGGQTNFTVTTQYKKFTYTFTASTPTSDKHGFLIYMPRNTIEGRQIFVHSIKLEEGNKITAWSPAPTDNPTKSEMNSTIEQTAENINIEVSKKVGRNEVISSINQSAEQIQINADKIDIDGKAVHFRTKILQTIGPFTKSDADKVRDYIMETGTLTPEEFEKYDINGDGEITAIDYTLIQNAINNGGTTTYQGFFEIDPYSFNKSISLSDNKSSYKIILSLIYNFISQLYVETLNVQEQLRVENSYGSMSTTENGGEFELNVNGQITPKKIHFDNEDNNVNIEGKANFNNLPSYLERPFVYGTGHIYSMNWVNNASLHFYVDGLDVTSNISDKRLKTNIKEIDEKLIKAISELEYKSFKKINLNGKISVGIIAQDLKESLEKYELNSNDYEIFEKFPYKENDETLYYGIDYTQFLLLRNVANEQKIQEQNNLIQDLLTRVEKLEKGEQHVS